MTAIKEAKDLATLPLDELIRNLKVYVMVRNDGVASKNTKEKVKWLALKGKATREQTSDDSDSQRGSDGDKYKYEAKEFSLMARNFQVAIMAVGIKALQAQDKSTFVTTSGKKMTSL
nr:hypothetical protein [Tanacetum cinerariifolium]